MNQMRTKNAFDVFMRTTVHSQALVKPFPAIQYADDIHMAEFALAPQRNSAFFSDRSSI